LKTINESSEVSVNWYYEKDDDDILNYGEYFKTLSHLPFKMIEVNE